MREGLAGGESPDVMARQTSTAMATLIGPQQSMFERLDAGTAATLVADVDKTRRWIARR